MIKLFKNTYSILILILALGISVFIGINFNDSVVELLVAWAYFLTIFLWAIED